jgi:predicted DsbA family dithiol-disulfide isomerase
MLVEIWSDVVCPWCYIGKRRFEEALARYPGRDDVRVVYRAFQLDPTAPPGVATPVREVYDRKFGPDRAVQLIDRVTTTAAEVGLDFHLERAQRANTLLAHELLALAAARGGAVQEATKERLLRAYFTEGRNVGDPDVLAELAAEVGLDHDEVLAALADGTWGDEVASEIEQAQELGISAVPTYVFDGRWSVPGAQDPDTFVRVLERVAEMEAAASEPA